MSGITTWSQLLERLLVLIDGDDAGSSTIPVATLTAIVRMGEDRIYREVRTRFNEKAFAAVAVTSNLAPIPTDYKAPSIVHFGRKPLDPVAEAWLQDYNLWSQGGEALYFAEAGASLLFGPAVTDGTLVQGRYFCRLPALAEAGTITNALFLDANDLFLYASLSESAPFFDQEARIPLWEGKYRSIRDAINKESQMAAYSVGRMKRRPSTPILR